MRLKYFYFPVLALAVLLFNVLYNLYVLCVFSHSVTSDSLQLHEL